MKSATVRDGAMRMSTAFVRNLPVALLCCIGYFIFFAQVWGPITTWKLCFALAVLVGLSLTLRLSVPRRQSGARTRRRQLGGHEAVVRADWPVWRRAAAVVTGIAFGFAGIYQSLGLEVDLNYYPLISGLCVMLSLAVGVTLVVWGWPRARWKNRHPPLREGRRPRRISGVGAPKPGVGSDRSSTLRMPVPKDSGFSGVWGGFGSRPAHQVWTPGGSTSNSEPEPVPARFRGLRLFRRRPQHAMRIPSYLWILVLVAAAVLLLALLG